MTQLDTTMSLNPSRGFMDWNYQKHLGSRLIHTSFGHDQIVSVFFARNLTTNNIDGAAQVPLYMVSIYDVTTDTRWEEPLYLHTSQLSGDHEEDDSWHAHYETDINTDNQRWVHASDDEYFYFVEMALNTDTDILFFGSSKTGVWAYVPSIFRHPNRKFVDSTNQHEWARPYGESSLVRPVGTVVPTTLAGDSFQYFRPDEVGRVNVVGRLGRRVVYATDHVLLFSDEDAYAEIITDNYVTIPSDYPISALAEFNGQLLVWTTNETYVYTPSSGSVVSAGRLLQVSDTVGCVGPNAWAKADDLLFFTDTSGVYVYNGQLGVTLASGDIDKFFTDFITNPLTSYFAFSGYTQMQTQQPHTTMQFHPSGVNVSYSAHLRALLVTVPDQNLTLCLSENKWSIWSYTSSVYVQDVGGSDASLPGISQDTTNPEGFVTHPWLLSGQDDVYLVGSTDVQDFTDTAKVYTTAGGAATDLDDDVRSSSYYLLRYGRGGAIDRSVRDEDDRVIAGKYITRVRPPLANDDFVFFIDPWIPVKKAYTFPNGYVTTADDDIWLCPLVLVTPINAVFGSNEIDSLAIHVRFDNNKWKPVVTGTDQSVSTKVDFLLPSERIASAVGYFDTTPGGTMVSTRQVAVYASATGAADNSGNELRVEWSGVGRTPAGAHGWYHAPSMSLNADRRTVLMYIPMRRTSASTEVSAMGWYLEPTTVGSGTNPWVHNFSGYTYSSGGFIPWEQWTSTSMRKEDSVSQAVDWAYKSPRIGSGEQGFKARGCWTQLLSHGKGASADYLQPVWRYGMYNIAVASEGKGWVMQAVDATADTPGYEESLSEDTIRTRVLDSSALHKKVFGDTANKWGSTTLVGAAQGTYIIDDQEVDTMATSLSVKGRNFTYMFFGFMQNRAQRLILESSQALLRLVGGRRRRGR